jgi:hypothetical protein
MGWRYILVNHTRKVIEDASLHNIWHQMSHLIREKGWETADDVEMMFEDGRYEEIGELVVNKGYKSPYYAWSFDGIVTPRQGQ